MGCGTSHDTSRVQAPTLNKKSALPAIVPKQNKSSSAKSSDSTDSGIEDTEPIKLPPSSSKIPVLKENLLVQHHQKSRLGLGETFDIVVTPKPGSLAPLRNAPRFLLVDKTTAAVDPDLQAKLAAKQERASRKRRELEDARRDASSRFGHRPTTAHKLSPLPPTTTSLHDERHQHLSMLRDKLRHTSSNNDLNAPIHTPRTPRNDSVTSGMTDTVNLTPRRAGFVVGPTTPSKFKPVYD